MVSKKILHDRVYINNNIKIMATLIMSNIFISHIIKQHTCNE